MNSIQFRLIVRLVGGVLVLTVLGGLAVYLVFRGSMVRQFDEGLRAEAQVIALRFVHDHDGRYEFNPPAEPDRLFLHDGHPDFYCIRSMDGAVIVKSPSLGKSACPGLELPAAYENYRHVEVAGHHHHERHLRAIFLTFVPPSEHGVSPDRFQIILAAEREEIDELLSRLLKVLGFVAAFAGLATAGLVIWTVRRDLSPLRALAGQAREIGAGQLDRRFALTSAPMELQPIQNALNGLLERMADALKRERRFTADVAHELRTPVAELRSLCEVAIAAGDPQTAAEALRDARAIGVQMEDLIKVLLALRRSEERKALVAVDIVAVAQEAWQSIEPVAKTRGVAMTWRAPQSAQALCDTTLLAGVLRNLFDNAANYTLPGGTIECRITQDKISIRNRPHDLVPEDIDHLTEPFWRKDASRSGGAHAGLGLALADAYCRAFGGELAVRLTDDWLTFEVRFAGQA